MSDSNKKILILGVGNILYTDEGFGVRIAEELDQKYQFSPNVDVLDGGTLGTRLIGPIMESDYLIIVDIVLNEGNPGDIFRLLGQDLEKACAFKNSMHQTDLLDTLAQCSLMGQVPDDVILYGIEPVNYKDMSAALSPELEAKMPEMMDIVLKEVEKAGGSYTLRSATNPATEKIYVPRDSSRNT
ncbi:Maturation element for hydrogenase 2 [Pseudodesulfovibrio profundus]|uniref:Maturation element for hydrogenase 2 n=1 Tax=Pseudodesulfovibrio profundus TaxID=57320 RepID=A0A2C8FAI5_9BACT|nr:HyaD/HybD family hydrogenase maturation endopeptidase [Pseudodesulfovibrio profundus]MBC15629.1 HyaD/HybD family hydrogenase maturation endopeptidase [Desulfovibrio sp.]SOB59788.1 Maturation element for hydrogenase 2 [Pseudodesulfovibrio profundus]|tara:strand:+ start:14509 stop:15063 length:555 start_codon:yes stop_codon:yes gene_type:complete